MRLHGNIAAIIILITLCINWGCSEESKHILTEIKDIKSVKELDEHFEDEKVTMAVFYKHNCPSCKKFEDTVNRLHQYYKQKPNTKIIKIEVDPASGISKKMYDPHNVKTVPTVLIYKLGQLHKRFDANNEAERTEKNINIYKY